MRVVILDAAHEDLRNIVAYIRNENPNAAESLGRELLDEAMSLESLPLRVSQKTARSSKTHPWKLFDLLPDQGTETGCRDRCFQAWGTDQMTVPAHQAIAESWTDIFGQESSGEIIYTPSGDEERLQAYDSANCFVDLRYMAL